MTAKEFYDAHYSDDAVVIMRDYAEMLTNKMYSEGDILTNIESAMIQGLTLGEYRDLLIKQFTNLKILKI